jgi:hypothetical protein
VFDSFLESPLDLAIASIAEPGPGLLIATSRMTPARAVVAAILGLACLALGLYVWRHRADWIEFVWPHGIIIPVFAVVSLALAFGHDRRAFDAGARTFTSSARLGPFATSRTYALPASATIKITMRKVYPSRSGSMGTHMPVRWYDVAIVGVPAAGFTVPSDREAARALAKTLAAALHYAVVDEVEDDGVERLKP